MPMSSSPEHMPDFRAPPPSPIASGRRSTVINDDAISEFLEHSLRIPELILPDRIFPIEIPIENPPEIDLESLILLESDSVVRFLESVGGIGCFLLVNHGIPRDLIGSVMIEAAGLFRLSPERKAVVSRSAERMFGFEEELFGGEEEEMETSEEFVWCSDQGLEKLMEGIWSDGYSNFSEKMQHLSKQIGEIANKVLQVLLEQAHITPPKHTTTTADEQELDSLVCSLYKHRPCAPINHWDCALKSDIIRMLIRGSEFSHALSVHICDGTSDFHIYSKKGWISFTPNTDAVVITVGDLIQAWSGGQYKNVMGRPVFKADDEESISLAFLYSPPLAFLYSPPATIPRSISECHNKNDTYGQCSSPNREKNISVIQQIIVALLLIFLYHFFISMYKRLLGILCGFFNTYE